MHCPFFTWNPQATQSCQPHVRANTSIRAGGGAEFPWTRISFTFHKPVGPHALEWRCCPRGPAAGHRSMVVIREGNYTHNLFNGPQVQQRREAHKDPDQGGLLPHRWEQEVQEHISESFHFFLFFFYFSWRIPPLQFINKSAGSVNEVSEPKFDLSCEQKNSYD